VDNALPGPPSFFSRQRDGIPVPSLKSFMGGYKKLFKMKLYSKTLENSYLILNRQVWTNLKQALSGRGEEDENVERCNLCEGIENTLHLIFECSHYSEQLWRILGRIVSAVENKHITLHAYNIMYNLDIKGLSPTKNEQLQILIQEIKRNIVYRRFLRATQGGVTNYSEIRIIAHIILTIKKTIYQRNLEGRTIEFIESILQHMTELI
jgi:DNA-binding SARP family transcriptional activator